MVETGYVICVVVLTNYLEEVNSFGTCKCISQLFKWDATLVPAVKEDWHQTQHHILHKHQKEEEGLGDKRRSKKLFNCRIFSPGSDMLYGKLADYLGVPFQLKVSRWGRS